MSPIGYLSHPSFSDAIRAEAEEVFKATRKADLPCPLTEDGKHAWRPEPSLWFMGQVFFNKCKCGAKGSIIR